MAVSYRLLYVSRRPPPKRRVMLPLMEPVLQIVAASGFVAREPVPLFTHTGASVLPLFAGVKAAEVPHDERLHQQHRERCNQGGPRPSGQPASTQAADHVHTGLLLCGSAQRDANTSGSVEEDGSRRRRRRWKRWRREEGATAATRGGASTRRDTGPPCGEKR